VEGGLSGSLIEAADLSLDVITEDYQSLNSDRSRGDHRLAAQSNNYMT
jgi:hypothetical protein